jgi:hypothetical protein
MCFSAEETFVLAFPLQPYLGVTADVERLERFRIFRREDGVGGREFV